jgi:aryl-alcohol dehydrogenase-like predicted oxidoreductase
MVSRAIDAGINLFDTADMYTGGESEKILGKALEGRRQDVLLATKCGFRAGASMTKRGLSYHHIVQSVEGSLKRLNTDYIDLFFLHIPDPWTPEEETVQALDDLTRRGLIRYTGFSNFPAWKAARMLALQKQLGARPFAVAQMYYSLLGRDLDHDFVPFLEDANVGMMAWSPLASGYLSGKYTDADTSAENRRTNFSFPPVNTELGDKVVRTLRDMSARYNGATPAQLSLAWLLTRPWMTTILVGASRMNQLEQNLAAVEIELSAEDTQLLDELTQTSAPYPAWMQPMGLDSQTSEGLA